MAPRTRSDRCPCDRGDRYDACCGPFHDGAEPPDAVALMRSRWSAFARGRWDHLWRTLHRDHDDRADGRSFEAWADGARRASVGTRYRRLRVLDWDGPDADGVARVLFFAEIRRAGRDASFAERSLFVHDGAGWRYLAGDPIPRGALPGDPSRLTLADLDAPRSSS